MISFTISDIDFDNIDSYLSEVPKYWKKTRGRRYWPSSLVQVSKEVRTIHTKYLVVVEWEVTAAINYSFQISMLIDAEHGTCEVFVPGLWYPQRKLTEAIQLAFKKESD